VDQRSRETYEIIRRNRVRITAVVATYNEERHVGTCLQGLLGQEGAVGDIEILVIDGMSTDRTCDIVRSFPEFGSRIQLLPNPHRLQVYAWNIAIREARGEYFAMILAHANYGRRYFASCLDVMKRTGAVAVGGVQHPVGSGLIGNAIAWCMSTRFGIGDARFRYTTKEEEADSVFSIFTRRKTLEAAGGYDERLPFDEDFDMNYRLRARGGKLIVSPGIEVRYHVRDSLRGLWMQMFRYGYWRRLTQLKHPGKVPWRVFAPAALVAGLTLSAAFALTPGLRGLAVAIPAVYSAFLLSAMLAAVPQSGLAAAAVPATLVTMHAAYGLGWWKAFFTRRHRMRVLPAV